MGLSPPRALAGTATRRCRWGLFLGTVLVIDSIGHAHGSLAKPEFFPDFGGIVQQCESQVNKLLMELSPFHKVPVTPSGSQSHAVRTAYTSLPPDGVKERVADATTSAWGKLVIGPTEKGISIWRRTVPGSKWDEVRGSAVLECKPASVVHLFETDDADLIRSFNPMYHSGYDIERFSDTAKAAYGRVKSAFPGFAPRDTVTAVEQHHVADEQGGGEVFVLRAIVHPAAPKDSGCVRARILSGLNLIQPVRGDEGKCLFTFTQHCDPSGSVPAWAVNKLVSREAVQFLSRIEAAAQKLG